jgi:hypothetical protein
VRLYATEWSSGAMACCTFERSNEAAVSLVVNGMFGLLGGRMGCLGIERNTRFR